MGSSAHTFYQLMLWKLLGLLSGGFPIVSDLNEQYHGTRDPMFAAEAMTLCFPDMRVVVHNGLPLNFASPPAGLDHCCVAECWHRGWGRLKEMGQSVVQTLLVFPTKRNKNLGF